MTIQAVRPAAARLKFGIAEAPITPPVGIYHRMWGAARHEQAEGVHRPLLASVAWMEPLDPQTDGDESSPLVLVTLDHCLLTPQVVDPLVQRIADQAKVPSESVLITFTHTHAAGLMNPDRASLPGGELIEPYLEELAGTLLQLVNEAREAAEPTDLVATQARCSLAAHRDYYDEASRQFVCGFNPTGPADDTLLVVRASRPDSESQAREIAWFVNYACHPTTLAWDNRLISPDFPGAMRELVGQATGAPCVYLQGASGDLGPRHGFVGDPHVADRHGRQLGYSVLAARENLPLAGTQYRYDGPVLSGATIGSWSFQPLHETDRQQTETWRVRHLECPLPYRDELESADELRERRARCVKEAEQADERGDRQAVADCRALIERCDRQLSRLEVLPPDRYPFQITICQAGDIVWVFVQGEPYQQLQVQLRERFPTKAILVMPLVNAWGVSYLPPRGLYGTGIYQETIAVLAPGALEQITETIARALAESLEDEQAKASTEQPRRAMVNLTW